MKRASKTPILFLCVLFLSKETECFFCDNDQERSSRVSVEAMYREENQRFKELYTNGKYVIKRVVMEF